MADGTLAHSEVAYAFFIAKGWPSCLVFGASVADCGHAMWCGQQLCLETIPFQLLYLVAGVYRLLR